MTLSPRWRNLGRRLAASGLLWGAIASATLAPQAAAPSPDLSDGSPNSTWTGWAGYYACEYGEDVSMTTYPHPGYHKHRYRSYTTGEIAYRYSNAYSSYWSSNSPYRVAYTSYGLHHHSLTFSHYCALTGDSVAANQSTELPALNRDGRASDPVDSVESRRYVSSSTLAGCFERFGLEPEVSIDGTTVGIVGALPGRIQKMDEADRVCVAELPDRLDSENFSIEQWKSIYSHQADVWLPCMRGLGLELGDPPAMDEFLQSHTLVDADRFAAEVRRGLQTGELETLNSWMSSCPDLPDPGTL